MAIGKRDRTRNRLLLAAQELATEGGFAALTVNNLTERAEVALGTFYNYYRTREEVLDDVCKLWVAAHNVSARAVSEGMQDPIDIVATRTRQTLHGTAPGSYLGYLLFECGLPTDRYVFDVRELFKVDLEAGMASGAFNVENEGLVISMISGSIFGVMRDYYRNQFGPEVIDEATEMSLRILGVPAELASVHARRPIAFLPPYPAPLSAIEYMPPLGRA